MRTYFIDFSKVYKGLLMHFLQRKQVLLWVTGEGFVWVTATGAFATGQATTHLKWLGALLFPLKALNQSLRDYVFQKRYELQTSSQVIYLEHFLNDLYDPISRRIYIEDGNAVDHLLVFRKTDEQQNALIYRKTEGVQSAVVYRKDETGEFDYFIVFPYTEPSNNKKAEIRANVDRYNAAGMRYSLNFPDTNSIPFINDLTP